MDFNKRGGYILLTSDFTRAIERHSAGIHQEYLKIFTKEDFLIEDSKEVITAAHITSQYPVLVIIAAKSYNVYAQNALLKILEEPPKNISFLLMATSKSSLLPTIRSRLPIIDERENTPIASFPLTLHTLSLKEVYRFLHDLNTQSLTKEESKKLIESLLFACKEESLPLKSSDLELFSHAITLAEQFERPAHIFLPLLLMVLQRKKHVCSKN